MSKQPHQFPLRVYYEDTDAGGVVYHARYLHFAARSRTEFLRTQLGYSEETLRQEKAWAFAVVKLSIDYHKPARLDDELTVLTHVSHKMGACLYFEQKILKDQTVLATLRVGIALLDLNKVKPLRIPKELLHTLNI